METQPAEFKSWAIVEIMGHVRRAGHVTQETHFGVPLLRIDIPQPEGTRLTQYYGGQAIYCLTPCDEAAARAVAAQNQPAPVARYELPAPAAPARPVRFDPFAFDPLTDAMIEDGPEDEEEDDADEEETDEDDEEEEELTEGDYERADAAFPALGGLV
jgi:hypothetical protein